MYCCCEVNFLMGIVTLCVYKESRDRNTVKTTMIYFKLLDTCKNIKVLKMWKGRGQGGCAKQKKSI